MTPCVAEVVVFLRDHQLLAAAAREARRPDYDRRVGVRLRRLAESRFQRAGDAEAAVLRLANAKCVEFVTPLGLHARVTLRGRLWLVWWASCRALRNMPSDLRLRSLDAFRDYDRDPHAWNVAALSAVVVLAASCLFWPSREMFERESWDQSWSPSPWLLLGIAAGPSMIVEFTFSCRQRFVALFIAAAWGVAYTLPLVVFVPQLLVQLPLAREVDARDVLLWPALVVLYAAIAVEGGRALRQCR